MAMDKPLNISRIAAALFATGLIAGCTGTSTYGTGKTQEAQLLQDVTGILSIGGGGDKKKRIDYSARPRLVKPPKVDTLPAPAEQISDQAGYFPTNPEEQRQVNLEAVRRADETGGELPPEVIAARRDSAARQTTALSNPYPDRTPHVDPSLTRKQRAEFLKQKAELGGGLSGSAPRKYLTQPPAEYRTPAETAPVGEVGEKTVDPKLAKKKDRSLFDVFSGE